MRTRLLALLAALGCIVLQPAQAQISPFRDSRGTPMHQDDIAAMLDATTRLLDRAQLVSGGTETWKNDHTGASGTVTAGEALRRKGLDCRVTRYRNHIPGPNADRGATVTWCKTKDGWKVA